MLGLLLFRFNTRPTVRNFMERFLTTLMLFPLFKALVKIKLKKFGIGCIKRNHTT